MGSGHSFCTPTFTLVCMSACMRHRHDEGHIQSPPNDHQPNRPGMLSPVHVCRSVRSGSCLTMARCACSTHGSSACEHHSGLGILMPLTYVTLMHLSCSTKRAASPDSTCMGTWYDTLHALHSATQMEQEPAQLSTHKQLSMQHSTRVFAYPQAWT